MIQIVESTVAYDAHGTMTSRTPRGGERLIYPNSVTNKVKILAPDAYNDYEVVAVIQAEKIHRHATIPEIVEVLRASGQVAFF